MSEYIIRWDGIGARVTELIRANTPAYLIVKQIRRERVREPIVRCRDCKFFTAKIKPACCTLFECARFDFYAPDDPDGFCAWGERAEEGR